MFYFNISFVIPSARKDSFLQWARSEASVASAAPIVKDFRIITVAAVPGDPDFAKSPDKNISLQYAFDSLSECRSWNETLFTPLMDSYARWHGPQPVYFATILKDL
ncbi:MAG: hypothetical protein K2K93_05340 [Muribaculaceae bacterium]|nr:hypothetical protein [Muribaculaceae bacterium]